MKIKLVFDDGSETEITEQGLKELMKILKDENKKEVTIMPYVTPWYPNVYPYTTWKDSTGTCHYELHAEYWR